MFPPFIPTLTLRKAGLLGGLAKALSNLGNLTKSPKAENKLPLPPSTAISLEKLYPSLQKFGKLQISGGLYHTYQKFASGNLIGKKTKCFPQNLNQGV